MYVCICFAISEQQLEDAANRGVRCPYAFGAETGAGTSCGHCIEDLRNRLAGGLPLPETHRRTNLSSPVRADNAQKIG